MILEPADTAVATERLCKHARCKAMAQWTLRDRSHVYAYVRNDRRYVGSGVFCAVRAEAI
jgi:hypothetical protein